MVVSLDLSINDNANFKSYFSKKDILQLFQNPMCLQGQFIGLASF